MLIDEYVASVRPKAYLDGSEDLMEAIVASEKYFTRTGKPVRVIAPYGLGEIPESILMAAVCGQPVDRKWVGKGF